MTRTPLNLADILDAVATEIPPDRPAIIFGEHVTTWGELDRRTNRVARALLDSGAQTGQCVAILSRNHPGYLETFIACLKARLIPVNLNYRYTADEIAELLLDSGSEIIVYQDEFAPRIHDVWQRGMVQRARINLDNANDPAASHGFDQLAQMGDDSPLEIVRSPTDPLLMYTGGTTGRPKGVVWPGSAYRDCQLEYPMITHRPATMGEHLEYIRNTQDHGRILPACPLMHGAGISSTFSQLLNGGTVLLLTKPSFDAHELWSIASAHRASRLLIVGDVFAKPMLSALDEKPNAYDLSSIKIISSSGLGLSHNHKLEFLKHMPKILIADIFGASEAAGLGYAMTTSESSTPPGRFIPGKRTVIINDEGHLLDENSTEEGWLARSDPLPDGYLNDPVKTAEVYRMVHGVRYAVPGDRVKRHSDGTMQLLGRGSLVINSGGEKIFVEEVEQALQSSPLISDALVVGIPDERWGQRIVALVQSNSARLDVASLRKFLATRLAGYKIPKQFLEVSQLPRGEAGKGDYKAARSIALSVTQTETD